MDILLLLLAEDATDALPSWAKMILGPVGVLVALGFYAYRTEKHRIPTLSALLKTEQEKNDTLRDEAEEEKDDLRESLKKEWGEKVSKLESELKVCQAKHTKERGLRTWWQAQAQAHGVKEPVPEDIDKTSFGSFSDD